MLNQDDERDNERGNPNDTTRQTPTGQARNQQNQGPEQDDSDYEGIENQGDPNQGDYQGDMNRQRTDLRNQTGGGDQGDRQYTGNQGSQGDRSGSQSNRGNQGGNRSGQSGKQGDQNRGGNTGGDRNKR
jgi:hypothetical protein